MFHPMCRAETRLPPTAAPHAPSGSAVCILTRHSFPIGQLWNFVFCRALCGASYLGGTTRSTDKHVFKKAVPLGRPHLELVSTLRILTENLSVPKHPPRWPQHRAQTFSSSWLMTMPRSPSHATGLESTTPQTSTDSQQKA